MSMPMKMKVPTLDEFERAVDQMVEESKKLGYSPGYFNRMRSQLGTLETFRKLIAKPGVSEGLTRLAEVDRLDLSVEAIALRFADFFSEAELSVCRARLQR